MRTLRKFDTVLIKCGGINGVAEITGRPVQAVCNWRTRGFYPAVLFFIINDALAKHHCQAARELFRFQKGRRRNYPGLKVRDAA